MATLGAAVREKPQAIIDLATLTGLDKKTAAKKGVAKKAKPKVTAKAKARR